MPTTFNISFSFRHLLYKSKVVKSISDAEKRYDEIKVSVSTLHQDHSSRQSMGKAWNDGDVIAEIINP